MNDPIWKSAAYALAEATPKHLDKPTLPPISWRMEGSDLVVLLADGRKVRGPLIDQPRDKVVSVKKQDPVTTLPVRKAKK